MVKIARSAYLMEAFLVSASDIAVDEIGDKIQLATVALAVKYSSLNFAVAGSALGKLIADVPAIFLDKIAAPNFPFKLVR